MRTKSVTIALLCAAGVTMFGGCAQTRPPADLVDARCRTLIEEEVEAEVAAAFAFAAASPFPDVAELATDVFKED